MTEIPDHLLKRSRDRRAALGLGGGEGGEPAAAEPADTAATTATPAATTAATPAAPAATGPPARKTPAAPAAPPPPPPDPPYVAAAKSRPKIPYWAMAALSLMPLWGFMYLRSVTAAPEEAAGPLGAGAELYGSCASCHGAGGEGGSGRPLSGGEVLLTFPHIEDQLRFVYFGSSEYQLAGVESYGNPDREGGPHLTLAYNGSPMPQQGSEVGGTLTDAEILAVVCHERYTLGGADPGGEYAEEYENWCGEEAPTFAALEAGSTLAGLAEEGVTGANGEAMEILPMDAPAEGSPPSE